MDWKRKLASLLPEDANRVWEFMRGAYYEKKGKQNLRAALREWYFRRKGRRLDLEHPRTFSEKVQWLKIYDATPLKTRLCDKYLVREWVKRRVGEEYLVPLLGVWKRFDDIDFDALPDRFVLKTNHSSGWNIIVRDKSRLNRFRARMLMNKWMATDFAYFMGFEMHYSHVKRRIIAEEYLGDGRPLDDYKVICFHGEPYVIWIDTGRYGDHRRNLYDFDWKLQPYTMLVPNVDGEVPPPVNLKKMREIARILSRGFILARIDFFEVEGRLYFGEITFTSGSGLSDFDPAEVNLEWGSKMHLPEHFELFRT